jgi:hypothetical protein
VVCFPPSDLPASARIESSGMRHVTYDPQEEAKNLTSSAAHCHCAPFARQGKV